MDVAKAFTFIRDDEEWLTKFGLGVVMSLLSFLIIPAFILQGYVIDITRNVMNGEKTPLPVWHKWGQYLKDGFFVFLALLVYTLPVWLLVCIVAIVTGALSSAQDAVGQDAVGALASGTIMLVACLIFLFVLALLFISPAVTIQYAKENELSACFRFGEVFSLVRDQVGNILVALVAVAGVGIVIGLVVGVISIIPCVGWIVGFLISILIGPYLAYAAGHLYGQIGAIWSGGMEKTVV